jgi:copper(I)-binding protein
VPAVKIPLRAAARAAAAVVAGAGALLLANAASSGASSSASSGAGTAPHESVTGAYVREPASPDVAAAYFTVHNTGGAEDTLTGVAASTAGTASMHSDDGSRMVDLVAPRIPAGGRLDFQPGANHVMLTKPGPHKAGDTVRLTLTFAESPPVVVTAPVIGIDQEAPSP